MKTRHWSWLASILLVMQTATGEELTFGSCQASISFTYLQRAAEADVKATVENEDCAASSGSYVVQLTIKADGAMETEKLRFEESWQRDNDRPVVVEKRYPIGGNVDLVRVRIRKLTCRCADDDAMPDAQPGT